MIDKEAVDLIKRTVLAAMKLREESYVNAPEGCDGPGQYSIDMEVACIQACKENGVHHTLAPLIWLAIGDWSNDVGAWAEGEYDSSFNDDGELVVVDESAGCPDAEYDRR
jgi:hypothetical protein